MAEHAPPLTLEEPLTLHLSRKLVRGAWQGLKAASGAAFVALVVALVAHVGFGWLSLPASAILVLLVTLGAFGAGAMLDRDALPPAAAMRIGADGVTARNADFERYYRWADVVEVRQDGAELVLMVAGGYAFRVPFRDQARAQTARVRIDRERGAFAARTASAQREQRDNVEHGDELRFIARQQKRLGTDYRRGHEAIGDLKAELLDADFQLQQRLGAAIALSQSNDDAARAALAEAHGWTACHILRDALDALMNGAASDDQLVDWVRQMHPAPRRFAPVGMVAAAPVGDHIQQRARIDARVAAESPHPGPRIAIDADSDTDETDSLLDAAEAESETDAESATIDAPKRQR